MKTIFRNFLLVSGISLAVAALASYWPNVVPLLAHVDPGVLGAVAAGLLIYQLINAGVWSQVLAALGKPTPFGQTSRVWLRSEALRWLPGGIWGYGSRVVSAKRLGVDRTRASASLVLELGLTNLAWGATTLLLLASPMAWDGLELLSQKWASGSIPMILVYGVVAILGGLALLHFSGLCRRLFTLIEARIPLEEVRPMMASRALLSYIALCSCNGVIFWQMTKIVPGLEVDLLSAIGITGAAWLAGFWAIGVPGGIGVREAALAAMLSYYGSVEAGIAVAVLWRALQMVVEIVALGLSTVPMTGKASEAPLKSCKA
ncbi:lysylphosphatidylglycerol synthase domain-containing protein [Verrucomicrobiaceae bacterium 227]